MRALHKGIHRAYGDNPHNVQKTIKAVYHVSYHMPAQKCEVLASLVAEQSGGGGSTLSGFRHMMPNG